MERKILLDDKSYKLSVVKDATYDSYSIAICDGSKPKFKWISKELYELLVKELEHQDYVE